jgi:Flp pilus assembly protein TadG
MHTKRRNNQRGYTTIVLAASLLVIIGAAGLAIDVGRIYSAKSDVQNFVDSASIYATMQLDGTAAGIANALAAVTTTQGLFKWDFATKAIPTSNIVVSFARGTVDAPNIPDPSTWTTAPIDPTYYRFAQVYTSVSVPLSFMGAFWNYSPGSGTGQTGSNYVPVNYQRSPVLAAGLSLNGTFGVTATSQAGQTMITNYPVGLLPFSPVAWAPTTPDNFGLVPGTVYTIRYPSVGGQKAGNVCPGDTNAPWINNLPSQDRGYWGSTSAAALRGEIVDSQQVQPLQVGQVVPMVGGNKNTEGSALATRVGEDSDTTSSTFSQYLSGGLGNGRRIVGLPINSGPTVVVPYTQAFTAVGIGAFFLMTADNYNSVTGNTPICAEYVGPFLQGKLGAAVGNTTTTGSTGGYIARLIQ